MIEFPLTASGQYELALKYKCPFCNAEVDQRCSGIIFPQYPHTDRLKVGLVDNGWSAEEVDARYNF